MSASHLSAETWFIVALIAGLMVSLCLATVAKIIDYERNLQDLIKEVREVRSRHGQFPISIAKSDPPRAAAPSSAGQSASEAA